MKGYAPIIIFVALTSGVQMLMLGVLGEYLWRALDESRRRPAFVVDEVHAAHALPESADATWSPDERRTMPARLRAHANAGR